MPKPYTRPVTALRRLNPRQIEAFRALMLTSSTVRAAQLMNVTQPAVSRLVRELQEALALTLFERVGNRLVPTHDARALYAEVERSFVGLDRIAQAARELATRHAGTLKIAALWAESVSGDRLSEARRHSVLTPRTIGREF
jgi:DNA-binding transcriptional LysR family regulator